MRTRFAPSPTGDLHLGGAYTALAAYWLARSSGGATVLRVEDLDGPRVVPDAETRQREDLAWLGLVWDEEPGGAGDVGPYRQSERFALYEEAIASLTRQGRTYPCDCSRAEIARVASAPHEGEEVVYPGTCRDKDPARVLKRSPSLRVRIEPSDAIAWTDGVLGPANPTALHALGDFVLRRGDGVFAYQLAVAVDDLAMNIEGVVRGDDLAPSTPRQLLLMRLFADDPALGWARGTTPPRYWHLPLVRDANGARLAKRTPGSTVRDWRARGATPESVLGALAHALGLLEAREPITLSALLSRVPPGAPFRRDAWRLTP